VPDYEFEGTEAQNILLAPLHMYITPSFMQRRTKIKKKTVDVYCKLLYKSSEVTHMTDYVTRHMIYLRGALKTIRPSAVA